MTIKEVRLTEAVARRLMELSEDWERENSSHGYIKNTLADIEGNRIFLATEGETVIGYLFGHQEVTEKPTSIYSAGVKYFEIEELYVVPAYRSKGVGRALFQCAERELSGQVEMLMLGTATKKFRAILHFYIDELGMEFWSARLFKKLDK